MALNMMDTYIAVNGMSDDEVKNQFGVSKANTLKVLRKLLIDELREEAAEKTPAPRKARKPRRKAVKAGESPV